VKPTARDVAVTVLARVAADDAYASRALDAELKRADLADRDAALATTIVYGALRTLPTLDAAVDAHLSRGPGSVDAFVRAVFRVATYQIMHLSRVPVHAAVDAAVTQVRRDRGPKPGGFVNAVLRKVARARPEHPAPPTGVVVPEWVRGELERGTGDAAAFLGARRLPPPLDLRAGTGVEREVLAGVLRAARPDAEVELGALSPRCLRLRGAGDLRRLPGYAEGKFAAQEQGSQLVGLSVGARSGERVLDACAGRGGKTAALLEAVGPGGHVTAVDVHESRLEQIPTELARLGLDRSQVELPTVDLTVGAGGLEPAFDRVLVDAPCTGLGTVHRRPEMLLRLGPDDPARLAETQLLILRTAAALVRPGGVLVYAVCSPTLAEGPEVARRFVEGANDFEALREAWPAPAGPAAGSAEWLTLADPVTCEDGLDAYRIFRWTRVDSAKDSG
jgi:16S rRNA (cytosine967-C5)-methyltransferase